MMMDRRASSPRGGWLVAVPALGALLLLGAWFVSRGGSGARTAADAPVAEAGPRPGAESARRTSPDATSDPRVLGFLGWVRETAAPAGTAPVAEHTAQGIHRLAQAMMVLAVRDSTGGLAESGRIAALDTLADQIARARGSRQGELTSTAFIATAVMMQEMHRRRFPNAKNDVVEARLAANAIRRAGPLAGQRRTIDQFFDRSAAVVRRMSTAP
jgi:hypothetical protein